eukprot:Em0024g363a
MWLNGAEPVQNARRLHSWASRYSKAPLIPLPIVEEPFSRIVRDIVGPLPRSGNKFSLVVCDYATRYPEAMPLKSTIAEHVAEELINLFARTDGHVERFNGPLKSMLRKAATEDWDKLIPYQLFTYREVPQASMGFSPLQLVYGRQVRGPLDVLKEEWKLESEYPTPTENRRMHRTVACMGAVLNQQDDEGCEHQVAFFSQKLLPRQQKYSTVEKECLAIRLGTEAFKIYLLGKPDGSSGAGAAS